MQTDNTSMDSITMTDHTTDGTPDDAKTINLSVSNHHNDLDGTSLQFHLQN